MNDNLLYRLESISVLDVLGADARAIVQNLTTNDVSKLTAGSGCESFVTDVRGKTVGHVCVYGLPTGLRMIGPAGQSERLAQHVDRYTIREDAAATIGDQRWIAWIASPRVATGLGLQGAADGQLRAKFISDCTQLQSYQVAWLGQGSAVLLCEQADFDSVQAWLEAQGFQLKDEPSFHQHRVEVGFPWYGVDLDESNLPQEAGRDAASISFTKGCYLGQETVARLDALGQVQKKLVQWSISGAIPPPGATLEANEKTVGRLTSVVAGGDQDAIAIGMARRTHFDAGSTASGSVPDSGVPFTGRVL